MPARVGALLDGVGLPGASRAEVAAGLTRLERLRQLERFRRARTAALEDDPAFGLDDPDRQPGSPHARGLFTCEWEHAGPCEDEAVGWRWDAADERWAPVCEDHRTPLATGGPA